MKVSSIDDKGTGENFTKLNRQTHVSSVSFHELLDKGTYTLQIEMTDNNGSNLNALERLLEDIRCQAGLVQISIRPLFSQPEAQESKCDITSELPSALDFNGIQRGELIYDTETVL